MVTVSSRWVKGVTHPNQDNLKQGILDFLDDLKMPPLDKSAKSHPKKFLIIGHIWSP